MWTVKFSKQNTEQLPKVNSNKLEAYVYFSSPLLILITDAKKSLKS